MKRVLRSNKYMCFIILLLALLLMPNKVEADGIGFIVDPIYPLSQLDNDRDFYYLKTKPGETQEVEATLRSISEEKITIEVEGTTAYSQRNGEIGYALQSDEKKNDETLINPLSSLLSIKEQEVVLNPGESKVVKFQIAAPAESYEGIKAGGIKFTQQIEDEKAQLATLYAYHIGIILSETADAYNDSQSLELIEAKSSLDRGKKVVLANIRNPEPKVMESLKIKGHIERKDNGKVIKEKEFKSLKMAPNSNVDLIFDWGHERLASGDYVMIIDGENDFDNWHLEKPFRITEKEAKEINESSPYALVTPKWVKYLSMVLIPVTIINSTYVLIRLQKRRVLWEKYKINKKRRRKSKTKGGMKHDK